MLHPATAPFTMSKPGKLKGVLPAWSKWEPRRACSHRGRCSEPGRVEARDRPARVDAERVVSLPGRNLRSLRLAKKALRGRQPMSRRSAAPRHGAGQTRHVRLWHDKRHDAARRHARHATPRHAARRAMPHHAMPRAAPCHTTPCRAPRRSLKVIRFDCGQRGTPAASHAAPRRTTPHHTTPHRAAPRRSAPLRSEAAATAAERRAASRSPSPHHRQTTMESSNADASAAPCAPKASTTRPPSRGTWRGKDAQAAVLGSITIVFGGTRTCLACWGGCSC